MRKLILLCSLLLASTAWADSMTGTFVDQPVVYQGCHTCGFFPPGTIQQTMIDDAFWGPRYVLADYWRLLPLGKDWVTRASAFTAEFLDNGQYTLFDPVMEGKPLLYGALAITEADGYAIRLTDTGLDVFFMGYQVGHGDINQVPEPAGWVLMLLGVGVVGLSRRLRVSHSK